MPLSILNGQNLRELENLKSPHALHPDAPFRPSSRHPADHLHRLPAPAADAAIASPIGNEPQTHTKGSPLEKRKPPALVSSCLEIIGKHLEDIIDDLDIVASFPSDIKVSFLILLPHSYISFLLLLTAMLFHFIILSMKLIWMFL
ncbi:hypothetical protein LXL04_023707 [Taraxacum kok-saghyz]